MDGESAQAGSSRTNAGISPLQRRISALEQENQALRMQNQCLMALAGRADQSESSDQHETEKLQRIIIEQKRVLLQKEGQIQQLNNKISILTVRETPQRMQHISSSSSDQEEYFSSSALDELNFDYSLAPRRQKQEKTPQEPSNKRNARGRDERQDRQYAKEQLRLQLSAGIDEKRKIADMLSRIRVEESDSQSIEEQYLRVTGSQ